VGTRPMALDVIVLPLGFQAGRVMLRFSTDIV
jgi:hypothetical protein